MTIALSEMAAKERKRLLIGLGRRGLSASCYPCFQNYYHALKYLRPNPLFVSNVRSSINHWQLRDLLQIDSKTGDIYHTYDDSIRVLPVYPRNEPLVKSHDYLRLPYFPRCFNHAPGGVVVAGGVVTSLSKVYLMNIPDLTRKIPASSHSRSLKGLFSLYSPEMETEMTFKLGEMINNAVTIYPYAGASSSYTSYVCNNDSSLYIVDIGNSSVTATRSIVCESNTSLNNVHQSPDGRLLTITGDSGKIFLTDPRTDLPTIETINTPHDSGFGISYHFNEQVLASAFQNGTCLLYDLRRREIPLREIKSTRPGHNSGAFRCCKFLKSPIQDLLVVLEQVGRVHLIDLRELKENSHQVIVFPFALDQFSHVKHDRLSTREKLVKSQLSYNFDDNRNTYTDMDVDRVDNHKRFQIYNDTSTQFSVPLVYDFDYLSEKNPKLFKDYEYQVPSLPVCESSTVQNAPPRLNNPQWNSTPTTINIDCDINGPFDETNDGFTQQPTHSVDPHDVRERLDLEGTEADTSDWWQLEPQPYHPRFCHDSYQQSVNHTHGEMELSGLDWHDNQLYIGCEDGGILLWDVNVRARRSFGSFSYA